MLLNDTLVFLLVSRQLYNDSAIRVRHHGSALARISLFLRGKGLYNISKSVLRSGQLYYW